ncbi:noggin-3-like [Tropilaelaps mercedesae]|uniref:Noggin-3-like n=1 Tax=Tropilaelaps mercedesae TaxID=418985 RepID=A0A1V9X6Z0_9ACAR|nr:noggin-3-like [Tropilaelaps mercedesae]
MRAWSAGGTVPTTASAAIALNITLSRGQRGQATLTQQLGYATAADFVRGMSTATGATSYRTQRNRRVCVSERFGVSSFFLCVPLPLSLLLAGAWQGALAIGPGSVLNQEQRAASKLLRPRPEEKYHLPLPIDQPTPYRTPEVDEETLLKMLGDEFQPKLMSIENPNRDEFKSHNGTKRHRQHNNKQRKNATSNRESLRTLLGDRMSELPRDQPGFRRTLRRFLRKHTECRVTRYWHDLGNRYFPRYIREGRCQQGNVSCSIPPGMTCLPHKQRELKLLWWHCTTGGFSTRTQVNQPHFNLERQKCRWIKIVYNVLSECTCRCKAAADDES